MNGAPKKMMDKQTIVNDEMRRIGAAIEGAIAGLTREQMAWHPAGKWSAAEILEHLAATYGSTARLMQKLAAKGTTRAGKPTLRQKFFAWAVTGAGYFPSGRQAPEFTRPAGLGPDEAAQTIRRNLTEMDAAFAIAEERFGKRVVVADHPVLGSLKLGQWRRFHWVHTRHHMRQIARLRAQQGLAAGD